MERSSPPSTRVLPWIPGRFAIAGMSERFCSSSVIRAQKRSSLLLLQIVEARRNEASACVRLASFATALSYRRNDLEIR